MPSPVSQQRPRRPLRRQLSTDAVAWKEHERQVAQAYQALGYSVTANVNVNGQQVDVVCEKHIAGAGRIKLYVECKYTAPGNPSISKDEVTQFIANFRALKGSRGFTIGVMVSNQEFSQYARAAAADHADIELTMLNALDTDAFGVRPYLQGASPSLTIAITSSPHPAASSMTCRCIERIESIYDLEDLARRPILLKLIVESLPKFRESAQGGYEVTVGQDYLTTKTITPSLLYFVYTEGELTREYEKGQSRWRIDRDSRRRVIARIAYDLMRRERAAIGPDDLTNLVVDELGVDHTAAEEVTTDIRSTSFLVRERNGDIRFSHKSFMEYFSAAYIRTMMRGHAGTKDAFATHAFSDEVLYFLGDILATTEPLLLEKCARLCNGGLRTKRGASVMRQNAANVLNYARKPATEIRHLECVRLRYLKLDIDTLTFDDCSIDYVDIKRTKIANWHCSRTTFVPAQILKSELTSATFDRGSEVILEWLHGTGTVTVKDGAALLSIEHGSMVSVAAVNSSLLLATKADGLVAGFLVPRLDLVRKTKKPCPCAGRRTEPIDEQHPH